MASTSCEIHHYTFIFLIRPSRRCNCLNVKQLNVTLKKYNYFFGFIFILVIYIIYIYILKNEKFEILKNILPARNYTTLTTTNKKEEYRGLCTIRHSASVIDIQHSGEDKHEEILRHVEFNNDVTSLHMSSSTNATHCCILKKASGNTCVIEGSGFSKRLNRPVQVKRIMKNEDGQINTKVYVKGHADKEFKLHRKIISTPLH